MAHRQPEAGDGETGGARQEAGDEKIPHETGHAGEQGGKLPEYSEEPNSHFPFATKTEEESKGSSSYNAKQQFEVAPSPVKGENSNAQNSEAIGYQH